MPAPPSATHSRSVPHLEALYVVEIDADNRIAKGVLFNRDDVDAAFEELDARYLAGEAAAHAQAWSVIAHTYSALNRHQPPPTSPNLVDVDHRRLATIEGDLTAYLRATWDQTPRFSCYVEEVHRLSDLGVVVTHTAHGITPDGFDAEWRLVGLLTSEGNVLNRYEVF